MLWFVIFFLFSLCFASLKLLWRMSAHLFENLFLFHIWRKIYRENKRHICISHDRKQYGWLYAWKHPPSIYPKLLASVVASDKMLARFVHNEKFWWNFFIPCFNTLFAFRWKYRNSARVDPFTKCAAAKWLLLIRYVTAKLLLVTIVMMTTCSNIHVTPFHHCQCYLFHWQHKSS